MIPLIDLNVTPPVVTQLTLQAALDIPITNPHAEPLSGDDFEAGNNVFVRTGKDTLLFRKLVGVMPGDTGEELWLLEYGDWTEGGNYEKLHLADNHPIFERVDNGYPVAVVSTSPEAVARYAKSAKTDKKYTVGSRAAKVRLYDMGCYLNAPLDVQQELFRIKSVKYPDSSLDDYRDYIESFGRDESDVKALVGSLNPSAVGWGDLHPSLPSTVFTMLVLDTDKPGVLSGLVIVSSEDPETRRLYSPNTLGHYHTLRWAGENGYHTVDFGDYQPYKANLGFPVSYWPQLRLSPTVLNTVLSNPAC